MTAGQGARSGRSRWLRPRRGSAYFLVGVLLVTVGVGGYLWQERTVTRPAFVAAEDLPAYHQITIADVRRVHLRSHDLPRGVVTSLASVIGHYTVGKEQRGRPFNQGRLGPRLPVGALLKQSITGLTASTADIGGGTLERADRVRILLSSTSSDQPRNGVIEATVLDVKPDSSQPGQFVVICAFATDDESTLLTAGGTARIFFVRIGSATAP